jgi:membrane protein DedA with SNARE-associated domain
MTPFAPIIALAIAFLVLLRVLIWKQRRDAKRRGR